MQADWNVTDTISPAYVANKPFYDTREYGNITLTFDGDIAGKEAIILGGDGVETIYGVKISDKVAPKEGFIGASLSMTDGGSTQTIEVSEDDIDTMSETAFVLGQVVIVCSAETMMDGVTLTPGIWVICGMIDGTAIYYVSKLSWYGIANGSLKQLDAKYVPFVQADWAETDETSAAFIKNKEEFDIDITATLISVDENGAPEWEYTVNKTNSYANIVAKMEAGVKLNGRVKFDSISAGEEDGCYPMLAYGTDRGWEYWQSYGEVVWYSSSIDMFSISVCIDMDDQVYIEAWYN